MVIKAQLDFQQKVENQISMLQTMMQTVCQLVNNEVISAKKTAASPALPPPPAVQSARTRRDHVDFQMPEPRQNWPSGSTAAQRPKQTSADELLAYTQRMNAGWWPSAAFDRSIPFPFLS